MPDTIREVVAYSIIAVVVVGAATAWLATAKRRRENALRRRGTKSHNRAS